MSTRHVIAEASSDVAALGANAARLLAQLRYWLAKPGVGVEREGRRWVYNTYAEWARQTGLTVWQVRHALERLEQAGLVETLAGTGRLLKHYRVVSPAERGQAAVQAAEAEPQLRGSAAQAVAGRSMQYKEQRLLPKITTKAAARAAAWETQPAAAAGLGAPPAQVGGDRGNTIPLTARDRWVDSDGNVWCGRELEVPASVSAAESRAHMQRIAAICAARGRDWVLPREAQAQLDAEIAAYAQLCRQRGAGITAPAGGWPQFAAGE